MNRPEFIPTQPITVHADPAVLDEVTITTAEWCPECDGEKVFMVDIAGGRWNSYIGTWEPDEREEPCERCNALGTVTRTRCARCGELHPADEWGILPRESSCDCDNAALMQFHYLSLELERVARSDALLGKSTSAEWNDVHYLAARLGTPIEYDRAGKLTWAVARIATVDGQPVVVRALGSYGEEAARGLVTQAA